MLSGTSVLLLFRAHALVHLQCPLCSQTHRMAECGRDRTLEGERPSPPYVCLGFLVVVRETLPRRVPSTSGAVGKEGPCAPAQPATGKGLSALLTCSGGSVPCPEHVCTGGLTRGKADGNWLPSILGHRISSFKTELPGVGTLGAHCWRCALWRK